MPFLSHGGINLRYERAGSGVPLVFLHPLLANHSFWERQVPMRQHCQILRIDLRGHGDSSKPKASYGIATLAEDVRHVVTAFDLRRVILVGSSTGALIAQQALPLLEDRVAGLVLVGTTACFASQKGYPHGIEAKQVAKFRAAAQEDFKAFARDLAALLFRPGGTPLLQWATQEISKTPPYVGAAVFESLLGADFRKTLGAIGVPALICHGRHDALVPFAAAEYLHKRIKGSRLVAFEESGHLPMIEQHDLFNSELQAFVDQATGH